MGKQTINVGTTANDGTGSTIRAGGQIINNNFKLKRVGNINENFTDKIENSNCDVNNVNTIEIGSGVFHTDKQELSDDLSLDSCKDLCESIGRCSHYTHEKNVEGYHYGNCKLYETCIPTPKELKVENIDIHCALKDKEKCKEKREEYPLITSNRVMPFNQYGKKNVKCEGKPIETSSFNSLTNKSEKVCVNLCHDDKRCNLMVYEKGNNMNNGKCIFYENSDDCNLVKSDKHNLYCRVPNKECSKIMRKHISGTMLTGSGAEGRRYVFNTSKQDIPVVFK